MRYLVPGRVPVWTVAAIVTAFAATRFSVTLVPIAAAGVVAAIDAAMSWSVLRNTPVAVFPQATLVPASRPALLEARADRRIVVDLCWRGERVGAGPGGLLAVPVGRVELITHVDLALTCTHLGLVRLRRHVTAALSGPLYHTPTIDREAPDVVVHGEGDLSATREYRPGDRPSRINWPASARTGDLLVRAADPVHGKVVAVVDAGSGTDPEDTSWLDRAATVLAHASERTGDPVRLVSCEIGEQAPRSAIVDAEVFDRDDLLRRLTRVVPGCALPPVEQAIVFTPDAGGGR